MSYTPKQLVLLSSQSASASSNISFTSIITSKYTSYLIKLRGVTFSANCSLNIELSTNNGSSWLGSNYTNQYTSAGLSGISTTSTVGDSFISGPGQYDSALANNNLVMDVNLYNFGSASLLNYVEYSSIFNFSASPGDCPIFWFQTQAYNSALSINAIRFVPDAGNITSGTFSFYGVVEP